MGGDGDNLEIYVRGDDDNVEEVTSGSAGHQRACKDQSTVQYKEFEKKNVIFVD